MAFLNTLAPRANRDSVFLAEVLIGEISIEKKSPSCALGRAERSRSKTKPTGSGQRKALIAVTERVCRPA